jgi:hypothetical protein
LSISISLRPCSEAILDGEVIAAGEPEYQFRYFVSISLAS